MMLDCFKDDLSQLEALQVNPFDWILDFSQTKILRL
jgi:hypothetical protein